MGRHTMSMQGPEEKRKGGEHPIWRGIGCLILIIVPVLSYATAVVTLPFLSETGFISSDLMTKPALPAWLRVLPGLAGIANSLIAQPGFTAIMMLTVFYIILWGGVFSVLYGIMYRMVGPKRYGPLDAPPPSTKTKKYKR